MRKRGIGPFMSALLMSEESDTVTVCLDLTVDCFGTVGWERHLAYRHQSTIHVVWSNFGTGGWMNKNRKL